MSFLLVPDNDALFLDIDGTLLDIAPTPDGVVMPKTLKEDLARLYVRMGGALALVSGRPVAFIDRLLDPLKLPAAGVHGAEWRGYGKDAVQTNAALPETLRSAIHDAFQEFPDIHLEDKGLALAVHFRNAPQMEDVVKGTMRKLVEKAGGSFKLLAGKMVLEVMRAAYDKGEAVERFMQHAPFKNRRPVFVGDDITDLPAMEMCEQHGGKGAQVGPGHTFLNPDAVRAWLRAMAA